MGSYFHHSRTYFKSSVIGGKTRLKVGYCELWTCFPEAYNKLLIWFCFKQIAAHFKTGLVKRKRRLSARVHVSWENSFLRAATFKLVPWLCARGEDLAWRVKMLSFWYGWYWKLSVRLEAITIIRINVLAENPNDIKRCMKNTYLCFYLLM